ncbi:BTAD domain-containing putative transcriptional regulator [Streptomyces sp. NPDC056480]|uniref:AfsR/SARP family transcriptional regulator n=1 Tax=Streptomyces sp. NPDC056480 TaxID=3345833 RepID=UPI003676EA3D
MGEHIGFGLLGPLVVTAGGRTVQVRSARQRTVLALLLLSPGRIVPVDTLVEEVWNGSPPATARTQVAIVVAALRKALKAEGAAAEDVIVTAHPGYLLRTEEHALDTTSFTELLAEAETAVRERRPADAERHFAQALALWRGPALAGVAGRLVEDEAARWEESRVHAQEAWAGVRLELGRHRSMLAELAGAVQEHPLRERAWYHLILARYRSGRRAEALEGYREARRRFVDEHGMDPGPELRRLHDAILRDDPGLAVERDDPAPAVGAGRGPTAGGRYAVADVGAPADGPRPRALLVPSELPLDVPGFAGRGDELDGLDGLVEAARDGSPNTPTVGLITGVGGVGKTGLAVRWAHRVAEHFPDGRLFADLRGYDEQHAPTAAGDVLSRFLRALGVASDDVPNGLEERIALYRSVLAERRVLLVLDNARTYAQIEPLLPGSGGSTVLVTSREQLERLVTWPPAARIHLGLLPEERSVELLARIAGEARILAAPEDSARLVELCDRLPLAVRIAAARLASKPHWSVRHMVTRLSDERRRLDELSQGDSQVRAGFALSYRHLERDAARLFRRLGLLGVPDYTVWVGAALLDVDTAEAERLMEHLVDAQFLQVAGTDSTGRLRYRLHDLMRLYAAERARAEEPDEDRMEASHRVSRAFLTIAEAASRREYGSARNIVGGDTPRGVLDTALVDDLLAHPMRWFEAERLSLIAVVEQAARAGADEIAWELVMCMEVLFESRNYMEDWLRCGEVALEAARRADNVRGMAAMEQQLGVVDMRQRRFDACAARQETALALYTEAGVPQGRAQALSILALVDRFRGDYERGLERLREAIPLYREAGSRCCEAHALQSMAQTFLDQGKPQDALELGREALRIHEKGTGNRRGLAQAHHRMGRVHLALGQLAEAEDQFVRTVELVRQKSDLVGLSYALLGLAETRERAGDETGAEGTFLEALDVARGSWSPMIEGQILLALGQARSGWGRPEEGEELLTGALAIFRKVGAPPWEERVTEALGTLRASGADRPGAPAARAGKPPYRGAV